ncbi:MAG: methyltransferase domain-containing protein [Pseudomonadota bacterium]
MELIGSRCPMCGNNKGRFKLEFRPPNLEQNFRVEDCLACGVSHVNPRPSRAELHRFFTAADLFRKSTDPEGRDRSLVRERGRRTREFSRYVRQIKAWQPRGKVLDAGCGLGLFLELLGPDFDRLGLDLNPFPARFARDRLDFEIRTADVLEADFPPGSFDLAAIMQTLDHLDQPGLFLRKAAGWVRRGGFLYLAALVNLKSAMFYLYKDRFRLLHPFHLVYFTPAVLRRHLENLGFRIVRLEFPYFHTQFFTAREVMGLGKKLVRRVRSRSGSADYSPPFYGNTMNILAIKA